MHTKIVFQAYVKRSDNVAKDRRAYSNRYRRIPPLFTPLFLASLALHICYLAPKISSGYSTKSAPKIAHLDEVCGVRFKIWNPEDVLITRNQLPELSERRQRGGL